jgi:hypothetical protein
MENSRNKTVIWILSLSIVLTVAVVACLATLSSSKPFGENLEALSREESIVVIPCLMRTAAGSELTYPICHEDSYQDQEKEHITYCLFTGLSNTRQFECVNAL